MFGFMKKIAFGNSNLQIYEKYDMPERKKVNDRHKTVNGKIIMLGRICKLKIDLIPG